MSRQSPIGIGIIDRVAEATCLVRVTGINLRLLKNPGVPLNDLRKWCRTSIVQIQHFYDQAHPEKSAARVAGRTTPSKTQ